jgi:hypothetical protein
VTGNLDVREVAPRLPEEAPPDTTGDNGGMGDEIEVADDEAIA